MVLLLTCACNEETTSPQDMGQSDVAAMDLARPDSARPDRGPPDGTVDGPIPACPGYAAPNKAGTVTAAAITEASGLAASTINPGVLWVHNDSGDSARVFALSSTGKLLGTYKLAGASAVDWEDMAAGPGPKKGAHYLYMADVGDNFAQRKSITVYRVLEPKVSKPTGAPKTHTLSGVEAIQLKYPDGAHDCEALLVDPSTGDILLITKSLTGTSHVYLAAAPHKTGAGVTTTLSKKAALAFGSAPLTGIRLPLVTAADVTPDGQGILMRTYQDVVFFKRPKGAPLYKALTGRPCAAPAATENQGESIAAARIGAGYFTLSEGGNQPLNYYGTK